MAIEEHIESLGNAETYWAYHKDGKENGCDFKV
jgi:hypothetical protein